MSASSRVLGGLKASGGLEISRSVNDVSVFHSVPGIGHSARKRDVSTQRVPARAGSSERESGAAEFLESRFIDDEEAVLALHEPHAPEPDPLGRNRLPGGPDQVRQVLVRQAQVDHGPLRGFLTVLLAEPEKDLSEAIAGPGVSEIPGFHLPLRQPLRAPVFQRTAAVRDRKRRNRPDGGTRRAPGG